MLPGTKQQLQRYGNDVNAGGGTVSASSVLTAKKPIPTNDSIMPRTKQHAERNGTTNGKSASAVSRANRPGATNATTNSNSGTRRSEPAPLPPKTLPQSKQHTERNGTTNGNGTAATSRASRSEATIATTNSTSGTRQSEPAPLPPKTLPRSKQHTVRNGTTNGKGTTATSRASRPEATIATTNSNSSKRRSEPAPLPPKTLPRSKQHTERNGTTNGKGTTVTSRAGRSEATIATTNSNSSTRQSEPAPLPPKTLPRSKEHTERNGTTNGKGTTVTSRASKPGATIAANNSEVENQMRALSFDDRELLTAVDKFRSQGLAHVGFGLDRQNVRDRTNDERFSSNYGVGATTLHAVFADLQKEVPGIKQVDCFMAVNQLKLYLTEHVQAGRWGIDECTFRSRWKDIVKAIAGLKAKKIKFDPDDFPDDQIFLLTVDGVNFTIHEPRASDPGSHWYDHKSHSAGVSYEVAVDIRVSRILWIRGPRPASVSESVTFNGGKKKDAVKDPDCLSAKIPEGKRAIADSGFKGSAKASTTKPGHSKDAKIFMCRARARMETLFNRFRVFYILRHRFRHDLTLHNDILHAVAVIVQYDFENGHPLFDI